MALIRSKGNLTTEIALGKLLWAAGLRGYRKHWPILGRPDFAWPGLRIAVFVDGCFWHGCNCKTIPKSNRRFWLNKFESNRGRDIRVTRALRRSGWKVLRVKECALSRPSTIKRIAVAIESRRDVAA
jgi:DNA mismatch endonuclease (patch repair protein)